MSGVKSRRQLPSYRDTAISALRENFRLIVSPWRIIGGFSAVYFLVLTVGAIVMNLRIAGRGGTMCFWLSTF
jgi:hypothetical protein